MNVNPPSSPLPARSPALSPTSSTGAGKHQPTLYEVLALARIELILLLLCIGQAGRVFLLLPLRAQGYKEILMGMKVELPRSTQLVFAYSDLIANWPILALVGVAVLLGAMVGGIRWLGESISSAARQDGDALARVQVNTTAVLTVALFMLWSLGAFAEGAVTASMLRLVTVGD